MAKWHGAAAARHLNRLRNRLLNRPTDDRDILHIVTALIGTGRGFVSSSAFRIWAAAGPHDLEGILAFLWPEVQSWPYVTFARTAFHNGYSNTRVVVIPRAAIDDPNSWQQYIIGVQLPLLATATGETIYMLASEYLESPDGPGLRPYDVNVWGPVVMLTGYEGPPDDPQWFNVTWREFISSASPRLMPRRDARRRREVAYARSVVEIAKKHGIRISPAELPQLATPIPGRAWRAPGTGRQFKTGCSGPNCPLAHHRSLPGAVPGS
jgi:hypothetical protein